MSHDAISTWGVCPSCGTQYSGSHSCLPRPVITSTSSAGAISHCTRCGFHGHRTENCPYFAPYAPTFVVVGSAQCPRCLAFWHSQDGAHECPATDFRWGLDAGARPEPATPPSLDVPADFDAPLEFVDTADLDALRIDLATLRAFVEEVAHDPGLPWRTVERAIAVMRATERKESA